MTGGLIASKTLGGFAMATTTGGAPGALFAIVTSGWSVTTTEEAATTIAHAKTLQRFSVMENSLLYFDRSFPFAEFRSRGETWLKDAQEVHCNLNA
jgi:hypothetical protein